jgi:hypothetical protein
MITTTVAITWPPCPLPAADSDATRASSVSAETWLRLPSPLCSATNRVLVAHIYHRIYYEILWETLARTVPSLASEIEAWRSARINPQPEPEAEHEA